MNIVNLEDYKERTQTKRPRVITFHSPVYVLEDGRSATANISVHIEDGDVWGVLDHVIESGGIGEVGEDGIYRFIPWPCAAVEIANE